MSKYTSPKAVLDALGEHGITAHFVGMHGKAGQERLVFLIEEPVPCRLSVPFRVRVDWHASYRGDHRDRYIREIVPVLTAIFPPREAL